MDSVKLRLLETGIGDVSHCNPTAAEVRGNKFMACPSGRLVRLLKAVCVIFLISTVYVVVHVHFSKENNTFKLDFLGSSSVKLDLDNKMLIMTDESLGKTMKVKFLDSVMDLRLENYSCKEIFQTTVTDKNSNLRSIPELYENARCFRWKHTILVVNRTKTTRSQCYSVHWETTDLKSTPKNCFSLSGAHWYGGSLLPNMQWPLEDNIVVMQPYISSPQNVFQNRSSNAPSFGPVLERMWFSSSGFAIIADKVEPLHVSVNDRDNLDSHLCLKSQYDSSTYFNPDSSHPLSLKYTVCMDRTAALVHWTMMRDFIQLPESGPDEYLRANPVWSTRGINMNNITETQVFTQQSNIQKNFFQHSQLHIGGNFTRTVGSMYFDHHRFSHSNQMVGEIKGQGFNVSASVWPVMERGAYPAEYDEGVKTGVFVHSLEPELIRMDSGGTIHHPPWEKATVALIDFTNPWAVEWMTGRLGNWKKEMPLHSWHFESGEATLLPKIAQTSEQLLNPSMYSSYYAKFARFIGSDSIIGVGYNSQQYGLMVDLGARASSWSYDFGLKSIIPSVLTLNLIGYPFVLVGPVGGVPVQEFNKDQNRFELPEKELYIRFLQLASFLPGIEMSVGPWQYNDRNLTEMAHNLFERRSKEIVHILQTASEEFLNMGAPVIRPLWWMATDDEVAQRIDCEFMVGNKLLVAPVLEAGAMQRSIYLPKINGVNWYDNLRSVVREGGQWLHGYKVDLYEVATFKPVTQPISSKQFMSHDNA